MSRTLEAGQGERSRRAVLEPIDLVTLTTYTDRDAKTGGVAYRFADRTVLYDYGAAADTEFEPLLLGIEGDRDTMTHLPNGASLGETHLRRTRRLRLRNGDRSGTLLWKTLRAANLERAEVELAQVLVDRPAGQSWWDLRDMAGTEHTVFFRGVVSRAFASVSEITLELESDLPNIPWLVATDETLHDPRDVGKRLPVVYGSTPKVPALRWQVGLVTTLAVAVDDTDVGLELSQGASLLGSSGRAIVGQEVVTWSSGPSGDLLTVVRGALGTIAVGHSQGEAFVETGVTVVLVANARESDGVLELFVRSPFVRDQLVRITTPYDVDLTDTALIAGETLTTISITAADMERLVTELAAHAQQANFDAGGSGGFSFTQVARADHTSSFGRARAEMLDENTGTSITPLLDDRLVRFPTFNGSATQQRITVYGTPPLEVGNAPGSGSQFLDVPSGGAGEYTGPITLPDATMYANDGDFRYFRRELLDATEDQQLTQQEPEAASHAATIDNNLSSGQALSGTAIWVRFPVYSGAGAFRYQKVRIHMEPGSSVSVRTSSGTSGEPLISWSNGSGGKASYEFVTVSSVRTFYFTGTGGAFLYEVEHRDVFHDASGITQTQLAAAAAGFGVDFYADVDGIVVPAGQGGDYVAGVGDLIERPVDVVRHVIADLAGQGHAAVADQSDADTNLGNTPHAFEVTALAADFADLIALLGHDTRSNIIQLETSSATVYAMLQALSSYIWHGGPYTTLTQLTRWLEAEEAGRDLSSILTRFRYAYGYDASRGDPGNLESYDGTVRIDADVNDLGPTGPPSDTDLDNAELAFGRLDGDVVALPTVQAKATAEERAGYYAAELIRPATVLTLLRLPFDEAYDLERGDLRGLVSPTTGDGFIGRIIEVAKNRPGEAPTVRLMLVE